jgi:hypothetical protein
MIYFNPRKQIVAEYAFKVTLVKITFWLNIVNVKEQMDIHIFYA